MSTECVYSIIPAVYTCKHYDDVWHNNLLKQQEKYRSFYTRLNTDTMTTVVRTYNNNNKKRDKSGVRVTQLSIIIVVTRCRLFTCCTNVDGTRVAARNGRYHYFSSAALRRKNRHVPHEWLLLLLFFFRPERWLCAVGHAAWIRRGDTHTTLRNANDSTRGKPSARFSDHSDRKQPSSLSASNTNDYGKDASHDIRTTNVSRRPNEFDGIHFPVSEQSLWNRFPFFPGIYKSRTWRSNLVVR